MGAGTFLSSRRFWEIRDSCRVGLTPGLPFLPSPQSLLVPQAPLHPSPPRRPPSNCSSSLRSCLPPSDPQIFSLKSSPPLELTSTLKPFQISSSLRPFFFSQLLLPQSHCSHLVLLRLPRTMPPPSDPHLFPQTLSPPSDNLLSQTCLPTSNPQAGNHQWPVPQPFQTSCGPSTDVLLPGSAWAQSHCSTCHRELGRGRTLGVLPTLP